MKKIVGIICLLTLTFGGSFSFAQNFDSYFLYQSDTTMTYSKDTINVFWKVSTDSTSGCLSISQTSSTSDFPLNFELCQYANKVILRTDFGENDNQEETILTFSIPFVIGETQKSQTHKTTVYKHLNSLQIGQNQYHDIFILKNEWIDEGNQELLYVYIAKGYGFIQFEDEHSGKLCLIR